MLVIERHDPLAEISRFRSIEQFLHLLRTETFDQLIDLAEQRHRHAAVLGQVQRHVQGKGNS